MRKNNIDEEVVLPARQPVSGGCPDADGIAGTGDSSITTGAIGIDPGVVPDGENLTYLAILREKRLASLSSRWSNWRSLLRH